MIAAASSIDLASYDGKLNHSLASSIMMPAGQVRLSESQVPVELLMESMFFSHGDSGDSEACTGRGCSRMRPLNSFQLSFERQLDFKLPLSSP